DDQSACGCGAASVPAAPNDMGRSLSSSATGRAAACASRDRPSVLPVGLETGSTVRAWIGRNAPLGPVRHDGPGYLCCWRYKGVNLLFVSNLGSASQHVYRKSWGSEMNVLFVSKLSQFARSVFPISKYVAIGQRLGHRVALYGERTSEPPRLPYAL